MPWKLILRQGNKSLDSQYKYWQLPRRVLSLWELMQVHSCSSLVDWIDTIKNLENAAKPQPGEADVLSQEYLDLIGKVLNNFGKWCELSELPVSSGLSKSLRLELILTPPAPSDFRKKLTVVDEAFRLEVGSRYLIFLDIGKERWMNLENAFGDEVTNAFPSISYDLKEACSCFAIGSGTACVFHLMRVLEILFKCLQGELGIVAAYTTWGNYLSEIAKANRIKNPNKNSETFLYYADIESQLWAIKNAWRDNAMHSIAAKYTEAEAETIFYAVKSVMQKAAQKLKEAP